jgi:flagellar motor switch protein FliG
MSKIQVTADVYAGEILSKLSAEEIADELLDRMNSTRLAIRSDAAKAITKLGLA